MKLLKTSSSCEIIIVKLWCHIIMTCYLRAILVLQFLELPWLHVLVFDWITKIETLQVFQLFAKIAPVPADYSAVFTFGAQIQCPSMITWTHKCVKYPTMVSSQPSSPVHDNHSFNTCNSDDLNKCGKIKHLLVEWVRLDRKIFGTQSFCPCLTVFDLYVMSLSQTSSCLALPLSH